MVLGKEWQLLVGKKCYQGEDKKEEKDLLYKLKSHKVHVA